MAVLDSEPGLSVQITVHGQLLKEYKDPEEEPCELNENLTYLEVNESTFRNQVQDWQRLSNANRWYPL